MVCHAHKQQGLTLIQLCHLVLESNGYNVVSMLDLEDIELLLIHHPRRQQWNNSVTTV
jgi:hypothetical protein